MASNHHMQSAHAHISDPRGIAQLPQNKFSQPPHCRIPSQLPQQLLPQEEHERRQVEPTAPLQVSQVRPVGKQLVRRQEQQLLNCRVTCADDEGSMLVHVPVFVRQSCLYICLSLLGATLSCIDSALLLATFFWPRKSSARVFS